MKKLLIILLSAISLTAMAQKKTITIQQPQCDNAMVANMVKSIFTNAFARSDEWQPVAEMSFEQMMNVLEDNAGNAAGNKAQYLLLTAIQEMDGMCYISCKIMNLETGAFDASALEISEPSPQSIQQTCSSIAKQLLEKQE